MSEALLAPHRAPDVTDPSTSGSPSEPQRWQASEHGDESGTPDFDLSTAQARPAHAPDDPPQTPRGQTWFMIGTKGGVGATVLCTSLAWALAEQGLRVVLIDLDLREGQAAMHLCERNAGPTVADAVAVLDRLDAVLLDTLLTPCAPRLGLLPSPRQNFWSGHEHRLAPQALRQLCDQAAACADIVLLDAPARTIDLEEAAPESPEAQAWADWLDAAHHRIVVTESTLSATFNARRSLERLRSRTDRTLEVVINKVDRRDVLHAEELRQALGGIQNLKWRELPRSNETVGAAVHQGWAVGRVQPRDPLSRKLEDWAREVAASLPKDRGPAVPSSLGGAHGEPVARRTWLPLNWALGGRER